MAQKKGDSVAHFFGGTDTDADDSVNLTLESEDEETDAHVGSDADAGGLEGEIAIDAYQTDSDVVVVSPIAGVDPELIEISATDDELTISGERGAAHITAGHDLFAEEIYWGVFSRTVRLPVPCEVDKASADYKHGVLKITIPKASKAKKRVIKVKKAE